MVAISNPETTTECSVLKSVMIVVVTEPDKSVLIEYLTREVAASSVSQVMVAEWRSTYASVTFVITGAVVSVDKVSKVSSEP